MISEDAIIRPLPLALIRNVADRADELLSYTPSVF